MRLRDNPERLIAENYALRFQHRIIYSDMDGFRHLNNGATGRYFEEGRADLNIGIFGVECMIDPPDGLQLLFATSTTDYLLQAKYPGIVEICTGVLRTGSSSYVLGQAAFQDDLCFALCDAVLVKAIDGRPETLSDGERGAMDALRMRG